jgi:hypothetical protein
MEDLMETEHPDLQAAFREWYETHDRMNRRSDPPGSVSTRTHVMRRPYARWWRPRPRWVWMSIGAAFTAPVCIMFGFIIGRFV